MARLELTEFEKKVLDKVKTIKKGQVMTYAQVAKNIGCPGSARAVGNALNKNPYLVKIPCHRVVKSDGSIGGYARGVKAKEALLKSEGIKIIDRRIR